MTKDEFEQLTPGDIVRIKGDWQGYIVTASYGTRATAVRTVDITNPREWDLIEKSCLNQNEDKQEKKICGSTLNITIEL